MMSDEFDVKGFTFTECVKERTQEETELEEKVAQVFMDADVDNGTVLKVLAYLIGESIRELEWKDREGLMDGFKAAVIYIADNRK